MQQLSFFIYSLQVQFLFFINQKRKRKMDVVHHLEILHFQLKELFDQYIEEQRIANTLKSVLLRQTYKRNSPQQQLNQSQTDNKLNCLSQQLLQNYLQICESAHDHNFDSSYYRIEYKQNVQYGQQKSNKTKKQFLNQHSINHKHNEDPNIQLCTKLKNQVQHNKAVFQKFQQFYQKLQNQSKTEQNELIQKIKQIKQNIEQEQFESKELQQQQIEIEKKKFTYQSIIKQKRKIMNKQKGESYNLSILIAQLKAQESYLQKSITLQQQNQNKQKKNLNKISEKAKQLKQKLKESKLLSNQLKDKIQEKAHQNQKITKRIEILQKSIREVCSQMSSIKIQKEIAFFQ